MNNENKIKFQYDESYPENILGEDHLKELKWECYTDEEILDEALWVFNEDDGNLFSSAEINKGIIYEYDSLWELLWDVKIWEEFPALITDFRDYVKADAQAYRSSNPQSVSIYYDPETGSFHDEGFYTKGKRLLTLTEKEYERLEDLMHALETEDYESYDISREDYQFISNLANTDDKYLNLENIEKRLRKIIGAN